MLDLLAAIVSSDPPALLAWLILAFAASGYPIGIMLGSSCSPCCNKCGCLQGSLPDTVTLNINGFSDGNTPGPDLAFLSFSSNFGDGASGKVTAPGGNAVDDKGPIESTSVTSGGSGYARIARVAPTVTAEADGGSGAEIEVTLAQVEHEGRPAWAVDDLTITNGGTGYPATGSITFDIEEGDAEIAAASATFSCNRISPSVSLAVNGTGTGAQITASLTYWPDEDFWYVGGVTVVAGGSGYTAGDPVEVAIDDGESAGIPFAMGVTVGSGGSVTGVSVDNPYPQYPPWNRGGFWKNSGVIESVEITSGGVYYRDDPSLPGENATVSIAVSQSGPTASTAAGAVLAAVIDNTVSSPTFGQITGVTVTNGGNNYLAWEYCEAYLQGVTTVLEKSGDCSWGKGDCGRGFSVEYRGASLPPLVTLASHGCPFTLTAQNNVEDCSSLSFTASDEHGRSASVSPGGEPSGLSCNDCIGTVTVGGQAVKINGPYTLICVEPQIAPPENPTGTFPIQMLAWAKAVAYCHAEQGGKAEIWVDVQIGALGIVSFPSPQTPYDPAYDELEVGAERTIDGEFAPYNFALTPVIRVLSLGPVRGMNCVGGGPQELDIGFFSNAIAAPYQCASEMNEDTRGDISVDIQCNAEE